MAKDGNRQKFAGVAGGNLTPPQQGDEGTEGAGEEAGTEGEGPEGDQQGAGEDPDDKGSKPKTKGKTYTDADVDEIVKKRISASARRSRSKSASRSSRRPTTSAARPRSLRA